MKIYTKTGDKGHTSLLGGQRVKKNHPKLKAYGTVDELNSHIGLLIVQVQISSPELTSTIAILLKVQTQLFLLGSHIACFEDSDRKMFKLSEFGEDKIKLIEDSIDDFEKSLAPLKNFILPGGSLPSAQAHICRTVCRRAERLISTLTDHDSAWLVYLNRLSDFFFVIARHLNLAQGIPDVIWVQD